MLRTGISKQCCCPIVAKLCIMYLRVAPLHYALQGAASCKRHDQPQICPITEGSTQRQNVPMLHAGHQDCFTRDSVLQNSSKVCASVHVACLEPLSVLLWTPRHCTSHSCNGCLRIAKGVDANNALLCAGQSLHG